MPYIVTTKIEVVSGEINRLPIAFENTEANIIAFDSWVSWDEWVKNNLSGDDVLPEHSVNPVCFEGWFTVEDIERVNEMGIELIKTI